MVNLVGIVEHKAAIAALTTIDLAGDADGELLLHRLGRRTPGRFLTKSATVPSMSARPSVQGNCMAGADEGACTVKLTRVAVFDDSARIGDRHLDVPRADGGRRPGDARDERFALSIGLPVRDAGLDDRAVQTRVPRDVG